MAASVFSLPVPLVLLIHLHLLQYPHANKPEYDHNVFDARVRGLRERTRTMEDVCYFLASRIEGKDRVHKVIPTYPCVQPADTTTFRTSLAKFLETLRHNPTAPSGKQARPDTKPSAVSDAKSVAWWWKDVVVRKSLLEECAGERFERLVLALSTHALLKGSAIQVELHEMHGLLRSQPRAYMARLDAFQFACNSWARKASMLNQRQHDLKALRANLQNHGGFAKYGSLSTEKLLAVAESKLRDLLAGPWAGPGGRTALIFLADLSGLRQLNVSSTRSAPDIAATDGSVAMATPPPPLPIAAAHHPTTLRKFSRRIFPKQPVDAVSDNSPVVAVPHAAIALSGRVDAEARMLQALGDSVARTRKTTKELQARLAQRLTIQKPISNHALRSVNMNLWQNPQHIDIDFEPTLSAKPFETMGLPGPGSEVDMASRTAEIRQALLPKYPSVPTSALRPTPLEQPAARSTPPQTPRTSRRITPPETVKPSSRHALTETHKESNSESTGGATPRARKNHSLTMKSPALPSLLALSSYPSEIQFQNENDEDDEFGAFGEGPSMSVRDLLLQADTSHFDIIDDESSELDEQSFGWA
ncbi:hypothetical protein DFH06DRAFT_1095677 [Mycena polygramma]|nr:hypothetical protein DFH06DRAFT_1095677 [Mycena polygramma]